MISHRKFMHFLAPWLVGALGMNIVRFFTSEVHSYFYMNWNLFLAFLPLIFLFFFEKAQNIYAKGALFFAWLVFLPNAIYMITDFIHLREVGVSEMLWFDALMLFSYAFLGLAISAYTMIAMAENIFPIENTKRNIFYGVLAMLSSFGIYLGRYLRWNSWDIILHPFGFTDNVLDLVSRGHSNKVFLMTIIFFSFIILLSLRSFEHLFKKDESE